VKRIVVCCDGTWNRPDEDSPTNVAKVALAVADSDGDVPQLVLYHRGVGTDRFERIRGGAFGWGLSRNVRDCYRFVIANYEPGDQLFFFGFSRGAYTARSTVGLIRNAGILLPEHFDRVDDAYDMYRDRDETRRPSGIEATLFRRSFSHDEIEVRFVGVWDTVGALGIPWLPKQVARRLWGFHDTELSRKVKLAYHALAIDEKRRPFVPSLWYRKAEDTGILEQRWFTGVHSDIGGGYPDCSLADITLWWMADRARAAGLALKDDHLVATRTPGHEERRLGKQISPDVNAAPGESYKRFYKLLPPRARAFVDRNKPKDTSDGIAVASTATARTADPPDNLQKYLDAEGAVAQVALPAMDRS
jgi:uncharacterized protein (DUF2235 family)